MCKKTVKRGSDTKHLAYPDALVIMSGTIEGAQEKFEAMTREVQYTGLEISFEKTEMVVVNGEGSIDIYSNGKKLRK